MASVFPVQCLVGFLDGSSLLVLFFLFWSNETHNTSMIADYFHNAETMHFRSNWLPFLSYPITFIPCLNATGYFFLTELEEKEKDDE